jgi:hypothetical protein
MLLWDNADQNKLFKRKRLFKIMNKKGICLHMFSIVDNSSRNVFKISRKILDFII